MRANEFITEAVDNYAIASKYVGNGQFKLTINNKPAIVTVGGFEINQHNPGILDSFYLTNSTTGKTEHIDSGWNDPLAQAIFNNLDENQKPALKQIYAEDYAWHEQHGWDERPERLQGLTGGPIAIPAERFLKARQDMKKITGQQIDKMDEGKEHYFIYEVRYPQPEGFGSAEALANFANQSQAPAPQQTQAQEQPWVPAHGSSANELAMFRAGDKPVSIQRIDDPAWKPLVDSGQYPTAVIYQDGKPSSVVIGQPDNGAGVQQVHQLVQTATQRGEAGDFGPYQNPRYHQTLGRLLGYTNSQIDSFISHYFKDKTNEAQQWQGNQGVNQAETTDHTMDEAIEYVKGNYPFAKKYRVRRAEPGFRATQDPTQYNRSNAHVNDVDSAIDYLQLKENPVMSGSAQPTPSLGYSWHTNENRGSGIAVLYYEDRGMGWDEIIVAAKDKKNLASAVQVFRDAGVIK